MPDPLEVLRAAGLIRHEEGRTRTTVRWQAAMVRAAGALQRGQAPWHDLRLPIAAALLERFPDASDGDLAALVEAMLPIEEAELAPARGAWGAAPEPSR